MIDVEIELTNSSNYQVAYLMECGGVRACVEAERYSLFLDSLDRIFDFLVFLGKIIGRFRPLRQNYWTLWTQLSDFF